MSETVTALVIVRKPGADASMLVDSSNVGQILPEPDDFASVRAHFIEHGFRATAGFSGTFTISAPPELFAELLPALDHVPPGTDAGAAATRQEQSWLGPVAEHIAAITRSEPVDTDTDLTDTDLTDTDLTDSGLPDSDLTETDLSDL